MIKSKLEETELTVTQKLMVKEAQLKKRQDTALSMSDVKKNIYAQ